jgi:2-polyprenyl-3-methyl-5-hydroxy-6-metoxy-1,4-benzoquinol methylase
MASETIVWAGTTGGTLVDVGCGSGNLLSHLRRHFTRHVGVDAVRYGGLPVWAEFTQADLNAARWPLLDACADVVAAVEVIEHLENPRAFVRELVRVVRPGGLVVVTTPNQQSFLSLLTLLLKGRFAAFQDVHYPAHLTALLEVDLRRIAAECGLTDVRVRYSCSGRVVLTPWHYPRPLSLMVPRAFSDNVLLAGRKPLD